MSLIYEKRHSVTSILSAAVSAFRLVSFSGSHALPADDVQGISEQGGAIGDAVSVVTGYSYPVEAAGAIAAGAWVGPASDGTGRVVAGGAYGRALTAATAAGQRVVVVPVQAAGASRAMGSSYETYRPGTVVGVWPDPDVPLQQGCTARPATYVYIDFDNGNDANAGTIASPKKTADVASWTGAKTSWFTNEMLLFRAGSLTREVTEVVTDPVTGEALETHTVRCGMEHLSSNAAASIGLTSRKHMGAYWLPGDDPTVRPVYRSLNNNGGAGAAQRCVVGASGTVTQIIVADLIFDLRDVPNRNGVSFGEFGDGQTVTNITVANCAAIGGTINDANSYSGFKVQLFGQYARTTPYLASKGILFVDLVALGLPGHGIATNGTLGEQLPNGRWHGVDVVNCLTVNCGKQYDTHGFTAYSGGVNLGWQGTWTLSSGTIYTRSMSAQYGRNVPDIDIVYWQLDANAERFQLVKNTATPTTPGDGEFGFDPATQLLYANKGSAIGPLELFSTIVRPVKGVRRINCRSLGQQVPAVSVTGKLEGHGFAFDDGTSNCTDIWCESIAARGHGWTINLGNDNRIIQPVIRRARHGIIKGNFGWGHVITRGSMASYGFSDTVPGIKAALQIAHASRRNLNSATNGELLGSTIAQCSIEGDSGASDVALLCANTSNNCPVLEVMGCELNPGAGPVSAGGRVLVLGRRSGISWVPPNAAGIGV